MTRSRWSWRTAGARAVARPLPRRARATSSATASGSSTRSTATASRRSCSCRRGRSSTRACGRRRSRTSPATRGSSPSTGAATAGPTGRRSRRAYHEREFAADALAVMDATRHRARRRSSALSLRRPAGAPARRRASRAGRRRRLHRAGRCRSRPATRAARRTPFDEPLETDEGWAKYNAHYWRRDYRGFLEFFFAQAFTEPHSTKQIEDGIGWGLETDAGDARSTTQPAARCASEETFARAGARVRCPVLVIHGDDDADPAARRAARALAEATGGPLVTLEGSGHAPHARDPVKVNLLLRDFALPRRRRPAAGGAGAAAAAAARCSSPRRSASATPSATWRSPTSCAGSIPTSRSTGSPSTRSRRVLEARGERIHPASAHLASESGHIESESRRARPALLPGLAADGRDPRRELHGLPRRRPRRAVRPVDRRRGVGARLLPAREPGAEARRLRLADRLRRLAADARRRRARGVPDRRLQRRDDRAHRALPAACATGRSSSASPTTSCPTASAPSCRRSATGPSEHFDFAGYVTGFDPAELGDRERLRAELGYRPGEHVCLVTVGGSGVGADLLRRVIAAFPEAKAARPGAADGRRRRAAHRPARRCRQHDGLEVRAYVHDLYRHLAACDLAVVQGGLTTAMELTANRRPFLYFPLRHHFEQNFHVRHRLERYGAGRGDGLRDRRADGDRRARSPRRSAARSTTADVERDGAARAAGADRRAAVARLLPCRV